MTDIEQPQLYLVTPPVFEPSTFPDLLARVLDARDVACLRLGLASSDEAELARAADACRVVAHARDIPLVINDHMILASRLGLDGVHLTDGTRRVRKARDELGADAIVGAFCQASRHEGLNAAEAGADYIAFGPVGATALGDGTQAQTDLFQWWSEMIEVPVVAEGALDAASVRTLTPMTDFFAFGAEIWSADDPAAALSELADAMTSDA